MAVSANRRSSHNLSAHGRGATRQGHVEAFALHEAVEQKLCQHHVGPRSGTEIVRVAVLREEKSSGCCVTRPLPRRLPTLSPS